jgi:hypothetical protein
MLDTIRKLDHCLLRLIEVTESIIYLDIYLPILRRKLWKAHCEAVGELLGSIGWIDLDV